MLPFRYARIPQVNSSEKETLPPITELNGIIDFLDLAKSTVRSEWNEYIIGVLQSIPGLPNTTAELREILEKERFRDFEMLRLSGQGELWRQIVSAISDREIDTIKLAKSWLERMSDRDLEKLSLSRHEIDLYLDLSLSIQATIDKAYLHQLSLDDMPEGKVLGPHAKVSGYEYLYYETTPYVEIFTPEFPELVSSLHSYSDRIDREVGEKILPGHYLLLSRYLKTLAESFNSHETNTERLLEIWEAVEKEYLGLAKSDCPIILLPWGFLADGSHLGIELMVTLNLRESSHWYRESSEFLILVDKYMALYEPDFESIPFIHQYVFVRNGLNLPWSGTACAGNRYITFYDNETDNFAHNLYRAYYSAFIDGSTTEDRFTEVRGINTIAHEVGHLGRMLDQDYYQKMGIGSSVNKLDEAKADSMANIFFLQKLDSSPDFDITPEEFVEQYIIDYIDETRSAIGHENEDLGIVWYDFSSKVILLNLFMSGSIIWSGDRIKVVDGLAGVEALASFGQLVFDLYGSADFTEPAVDTFVSVLEKRVAENPDVQRFLAKVALTK